MPRYICRVSSCQNKTGGYRSNSLKFYSFPDDPRLAEEWALRCAPSKPFKLKSAKLCGVHFSPDAFEENEGRMRTRQKKLKKECLPTLFLPEVAVIGSTEKICAPKRKKKVTAVAIKKEPEHQKEYLIPAIERNPNEDKEDDEEVEEEAEDIRSARKYSKIQPVKRGRYDNDATTACDEIKSAFCKQQLKRTSSKAASTLSGLASTSLAHQQFTRKNSYLPQKYESGSESEDQQSQTAATKYEGDGKGTEYETEEEKRSSGKGIEFQNVKRGRYYVDVATTSGKTKNAFHKACGKESNGRGSELSKAHMAVYRMVAVSEKNAQALLNISYANSKLAEAILAATVANSAASSGCCAKKQE